MKRFLAVVVLALACQREQPVKESATAIDDTRPRDGGTLIRRLDADITTLNPIVGNSRYDRWVANYLFTPLIQVDRALQPIPSLARSWEISDDGKIYRFELNRKATFSDGKPVRASDVLFTLRKVIDPSTEALGIVGAFELLDLSRTRVVDDYTIEVAFRDVLAGQLIKFQDLLVLPEHVYSTGHIRNDFNDTALGSGPYRFVRRTPGKEIVVERRADYWDTKPHIQTVVFKVINEHNTAWQALKRREIDETLLASDTWKRESNNPELKKYIDFRRFYTLTYNYIAWNNRHPILRDKRVRRALAMCLPVDTVVQDLYFGTARAMTGHFTPDEWAYNPNVPPIRYNPDEAKRILAEAGWADRNGDGILEKGGRKFQFDFLFYSGNQATKALTQMLQAEMKKIGVQMDLVMVDGATGIQRTFSGNYDAAYTAWDLDPDPDPYALFHSSQFSPNGQNLVFYSNPEADRLLDQARRELDQSKRKELYWRLHEVLSEDQPYTWVVQVSAKWAFNKRVRGVEVGRGFGLFNWYPGELGWWLADAPQPQ